MSKWPMVPLGEILTKSTEQVEIQPHKTYREVTVRLWGKGVDLRREATGAEIKADKRFIVTPGQFIVSRIDARNGAFGLIPEDLIGAIVSNDFPVFDANHKRLDPSFLNWLSKTSSFVDLCRRASEGTTNRVRLKENLFLEMEIPLPPLSEQKKIVEWIDAVATRVEEAKELRRQSSNALGSLSKGLKRRLIDQVGTECTRELGEIVRITGGGTPSKQNPLFWDGDIPWISPKDMKSVKIEGAIDSITEAGVENSSAKLIPTDAVLIVIRGMILAHTVPVGLLKVPAAINQDMKALVPNDGILPTYLCHALWALNQELLELVDRSTHDTRKLTTPKLLSLRVPVPDIEVQERFVNESEGVNSTVQTAASLTNSSQKELEALLPSVFNEIFNGDGNG